MSNLSVYSEIFTNGNYSIILDILTVSAILSGIFVIIGKNPILSVLFLIGLFLSMSCYLLEIGLGFIGISYLLVYVGAVSILFLFILMLLNVRVSELIGNTSNSLFLAIFISVSFYYPIGSLNNSILQEIKNINSGNIENFFISDYLKPYYIKLTKNKLYTTNNNWDGYLIESNHITSLGNIMYTNYSIWLILTSLILLLAMVGTIVITLKKK